VLRVLLFMICDLMPLSTNSKAGLHVGYLDYW